MASIASRPNELKINDLAKVLQLLKRHGYSEDSYYDLGLFLGLHSTTLDVIKENERNVRAYLRECLKAWLQKADDVQETKGGPTIYSLVSALRELGKNGVAHGIDMEMHPACKSLYNYASNQFLLSELPLLASLLYAEVIHDVKQDMLSSSSKEENLLCKIKEAVCINYQKLEAFAKILCKATATNKIGSAIMKEYREVCIGSVNHSHSMNISAKMLHIDLSDDADVKSGFTFMRCKFWQTFYEVGSIMENHPRPDLLKNLKFILGSRYRALKSQVSQCHNIHDILQLLGDCCQIDDICMLEFFVKKCNIEEAKPVIEEYKEAVEEFKNIKLSNFLEEKFSNASPLECERIIIVVDKDADDCTLNDVERLSSAVFKDLSKRIKLNVIRDGNSFSVSCSFPVILSEQLISVAHDNTDVLEDNQVKRLTIGYCTVYEMNVEICDSATIKDEQQFPLSSPNSSGLLKQLMVSLSVQLINSKDEDSMALMEEAESLKEVLDTKIKMMNDSVAESGELKDGHDELIQLNRIFEEQLASFQLKEKSKVPADKVQKFFIRLNEMLPRIASSFNTSVVETKALVDEATDGLRIVREYKEVRQVPQVKESYRSLSHSTKAVHTYLDKVNGLYRTLKDQTPAVIEDVEGGDVRSTQELAVEINEVAQYCKDDYTTLTECFREFATNIDRAQGELMRLKEEAETKRRRALQISAITAGVGVVLGVLTLGAGAAAGSVAAAAAAAGIAALAYLITALTTAVESFDKISSKRFKAHQYELIQNTVDELNRTMKENARIGRMTDADRTNLVEKMTDILEKSIKLYNDTSRELKNSERIKNTFTREVDNTFN